MKLHSTTGFENAKHAHAQAYAEYARLDDADACGTPYYVAACKAESEALNDLLLYPATTPKELAEKMQVADSRDVETWDIYPAYRARIEADLTDFMRPNCSPAIIEAFMAFRQSRETINERLSAVPDDDKGAITAVDVALWRAVFAIPCTTPGDFLLKTYLELLEDAGDPKAGPFEILPHSFDDPEGEDYNENFSRRALVRDLAACDLGNCLFAFGLPYFSASAWVAAAIDLGHPFTAYVEEGGVKALWQGMVTSVERAAADPFYLIRRDRLLRIVAFDDRRTGEIIAELLALPEAAQA